ncbi:unnamed protein product [Pseudo-nitzschia multistriata]|uniref:Uncharacterized protein n=1 Tax=Pseudo-nitzschia multistriata TaxID=183589 RepID=A0A448YYX1_9STRA|nr:unnamed protein product [Pseudo-nitzschia multistriata]
MKRKRPCQTIPIDSSTGLTSVRHPFGASAATEHDAARSFSSAKFELDPLEYHRSLVSEILNIGTEYASPSQIFDQMTLIHGNSEFQNLKLEQIKSHLQRFRKVFFNYTGQKNKSSISTNNRGGYARAKMKNCNLRSRTSKSDSINSTNEFDDTALNKSNTKPENSNPEKQSFLDEFDNFVDFGLDAAEASLASAEDNYQCIVGGRAIGLVSRMIMMDENVFIEGHQQHHKSSSAGVKNKIKNSHGINNKLLGEAIVRDIDDYKLPFDASIPRLTSVEKASHLGQSIELITGLLEHLNHYIHSERQKRQQRDGHHWQQHEQQQHQALFKSFPSEAMATAMSLAAAAATESQMSVVQQKRFEGIPSLSISSPTRTERFARTDVSMVSTGRHQGTTSVDTMITSQMKIKKRITTSAVSTIASNTRRSERASSPKQRSQPISHRFRKDSSATRTKKIAFHKLQKAIDDLTRNTRCDKRKDKQSREQLYRKCKRDNEDAISSSDLSSLSTSSEDCDDINSTNNSNFSNVYVRNGNGPQRLVGREKKLQFIDKGNDSWIFDRLTPPCKILLVRQAIDPSHDFQDNWPCEASPCSCCSSNSSSQLFLATNANKGHDIFDSRNPTLRTDKKEAHRILKSHEAFVPGNPKLPDKETNTMATGIGTFRREDSCASDISSIGTEMVNKLPAEQRGVDASELVTRGINNDNRYSPSMGFISLPTTGDASLQQLNEFSFSPPNQSQSYLDIENQVQNFNRGGGSHLGDHAVVASGSHQNWLQTATRATNAATNTNTRMTHSSQQHLSNHEPHPSRPQEPAFTPAADRLGRFFPVKESEGNDDVSI